MGSYRRRLSLSTASAPASLLSQPQKRGHASEIIPRLYISDLSFAENPSLLRAYGITHILSTLPETPCISSDLRLQRMQIKVEDFPFAELAAYLPSTTSFISSALDGENKEARVLVHCAEGVSRSVSVVAAYLMARFGWTPDQAVGYVKERRRVADPNFGFVQQLWEYGRDVLGQKAAPPNSARAPSW